MFLHRPSVTLIVADLIENFEADRLDTPMRWIARFGGVLAPDGRMPLDMRLSYLGHKTQARTCLERVLAWHPERVILAHGRCFMEHGQAELRRAFAWLTA